MAQVLADPSFSWSERRLRLQGWRGHDLDHACAAGGAARIAPAVCALGGLVVAWGASWALALLLAATAVVGVFADHHPVEAIHNVVARKRGRVPLPANRAAKRSGCAIGAVLLVAAGVAFLAGASGPGRGLVLSLAAVASFVAATNLCVPSMLFTFAFGAERATERDLL